MLTCGAKLMAPSGQESGWAIALLGSPEYSLQPFPDTQPHQQPHQTTELSLWLCPTKDPNCWTETRILHDHRVHPMAPANFAAQPLPTPKHGVQLTEPPNHGVQSVISLYQWAQAAAPLNCRAQPVATPVCAAQLLVPHDKAAVLPECRTEPVAPLNQRPCQLSTLLGTLPVGPLRTPGWPD